ncbi:hypothetical protein ABFS83_08G014300 [Erythranthe nasuta]
MHKACTRAGDTIECTLRICQCEACRSAPGLNKQTRLIRRALTKLMIINRTGANYGSIIFRSGVDIPWKKKMKIIKLLMVLIWTWCKKTIGVMGHPMRRHIFVVVR